jgi:tetratricopeptide (TPR) repeat protein
MMGRKLDSGKMNTPKSGSAWMRHAVFGMVCALVIGIFAWFAEPSISLESKSPRAEDSYYNLLVRGFRAGQLNVKREAPPELAQLADPYDPTVNAAYIGDVYDMSYYQGKLYLYFGVTPALVLLWPYVALTGHYLSDKAAVVIFFALGFLAAAGLLRAIWRRYFPEVSIWVAMLGIFTLGLALGTQKVITLWCNVYEIAIVCGFAFTMLALAALWCALHEPKRRVLWLVLASLAYGMAVGARPSLLFGIIILLLPVARAWRVAAGPESRRRVGLLLAAAVGPAMLIGLGLMVYNFLRFGNPFEFGWHYQLNGSYCPTTAQQFSLHHLWFNFRFYFLEPMRWRSVHSGVGDPYGGILSNYPLAWLALAAPLVWRGRGAEAVSVLRWFVAAAFLLFMICALTICFYCFASSRFELDFQPALILLAVIGIFGLERALVGLPVWRRIARWGWCLLLCYSVVLNLLAAVRAHADANYFVGNTLLNQGRVGEAIIQYQRALALWPESASFHVGLASAYYLLRQADEAVNEYQKALEIEPDSAKDQYLLGCALFHTGRRVEAIIHLQKALAIEPDLAETDSAEEKNNLAWSFATDPEASKRNGALAVKLAEGACRRTHYQVSIMVGTLATAYAEAGRFEDAISTAQKAITLAEQNGESDLLREYQKLLALYLKHQPYHKSQTDTRK